MDLEEANNIYKTNALGVVGVVGALEGLLNGEGEKEGGEKEGGEKEKARVVLVSSQLGSLRDAYTGGMQVGRERGKGGGFL